MHDIKSNTPQDKIHPKPKKYLAFYFGCLLFAISLFFSIAILEIGVRILYGAPPPSAHITHPYRIFTLKPNAHGVYMLKQGNDAPLAIPYKVSSQGLRGDAYPPKAEDEFRILLFGDSFTFGAGVQDNETLNNTLEPIVNDCIPERKVTVINAGTLSYGPWQQLDLLKEIGLSLDPDVVIHQFLMCNDIADTLIKVDATLQAYLYNQTARLQLIKHHSIFNSTLHELVKKTALYNALMKRTAVLRFLIQISSYSWLWGDNATPRLQEPLNRPYYLETRLNQWYPELERGLALMEEDILTTQLLCKRNSIDYIGYAVPGHSSANPTSWNTLPEDLRSNYERDKAETVLKDFFQQESIPYIDIGPIFNEADDINLLYYPYDGHWTPLGIERVANYIEPASKHDIACPL